MVSVLQRRPAGSRANMGARPSRHKAGSQPSGAGQRQTELFSLQGLFWRKKDNSVYLTRLL